MSVECEKFWSCAQSFTRPQSKNHSGWLRANLKIHRSNEIWPPSSPGVRHVTGNDQDYLRKIPRVVVQISALL